jgi:hypothetical protein
MHFKGVVLIVEAWMMVELAFGLSLEKEHG